MPFGVLCLVGEHNHGLAHWCHLETMITYRTMQCMAINGFVITGIATRTTCARLLPIYFGQYIETYTQVIRPINAYSFYILLKIILAVCL